MFCPGNLFLFLKTHWTKKYCISKVFCCLSSTWNVVLAWNVFQLCLAFKGLSPFFLMRIDIDTHFMSRPKWKSHEHTQPWQLQPRHIETLNDSHAGRLKLWKLGHKNSFLDGSSSQVMTWHVLQFFYYLPYHEPNKARKYILIGGNQCIDTMSTQAIRNHQRLLHKKKSWQGWLSLLFLTQQLIIFFTTIEA